MIAENAQPHSVREATLIQCLKPSITRNADKIKDGVNHGLGKCAAAAVMKMQNPRKIFKTGRQEYKSEALKPQWIGRANNNCGAAG